jgi:hypothetical protein
MIDLDGCRVVIEHMRPDLIDCYDSFASKIQDFAIERYDGYPFSVTSLLEPCELEIYTTYLIFMDAYCAYCKQNDKECDKDLWEDELKEFISKYGHLIITIVAECIRIMLGR